LGPRISAKKEGSKKSFSDNLAGEEGKDRSCSGKKKVKSQDPREKGRKNGGLLRAVKLPSDR